MCAGDAAFPGCLSWWDCMEEGIWMDIVTGIRTGIEGWAWEHPLVPERTSTENNFHRKQLPLESALPCPRAHPRHPQRALRAIIVPCCSLCCSGSQGHWAGAVSSWGPSWGPAQGKGSFIPWDQTLILPWPQAKLGSWSPTEIMTIALFHTGQSRAWRNAPGAHTLLARLF